MAKISLRAYIREIEGMINRGQLDEAVAHCQHILQTYPKLLAAYRLLGKTYLEGQRYSDASDVFLRVLSAAPDDYMAHLGMSMIREDEANLNAALWHMERAFEAQPSNGAIQGELRRLYGRRDGVEPPKVRMTRGALARMYARGNLHQQAIGELRAALAEDPQRPDLQVLLARMYFLAGQRVEAVDTCSALIKRLPYCLEANRLLATILPETGRKEDSLAYNQRAAALDPYLMYAKPGAASGDEVAENIVMLDHMDFIRQRPAAETSSQPAWATSLGVSVDQFSQKSEELPDWMQGDARTASPQEAASRANASEETGQPAEGVIPDWMKQAGWTEGTGDGDEGQTIAEAETEPAEGEIAPGMVPDWLKSMAPSGVLDESGSVDFLDEDTEADTTGQVPEPLGWLDEKAPGATDTVVNWLDDQPSAETPAAGELFPEAEAEQGEIPDWLKKPGDADEPAAEAVDLPDWMQEAETTSAETPALGDVDLPDWMQEPETPAAEVPSLGDVSVPDWMKEPEAEPAQPAAGVPDWLKDLEAEEDTAAAEEQTSVEEPASAGEFYAESAAQVVDETMAASEADLPDWLKREEEPASPGEIPDWLRSAAPEETPAPEAAQEVTAGAGADEFFAETTPPELAEGLAAEPVGELPPAEPAELPDWLKDLEAEVSPEEPEAPSPLAETKIFEQAPGEPQAATVQPEMPEMSIPTDAEAGLAWLESLAARQGVPEEELTTRPEERTEDIPDWIVQAGAAELPAVDEFTPAEAPPAAESAAESEPGEGTADQPGWLMEETTELEEGLEPEAEPELPAVHAEVPDWLKAMAVETPAQAVVEPPAETIEPAVEAELPDWLKEAAALVEPEETPLEATPPAAEPTEAGEVEAALPAAELVEEPTVEAPGEAAPVEAAAAPDLSDADAALAWLESLAAKQGVPEEELITRPEERPSEAPQWAQEQPAEAVEAAAAPEAAPEEPAEAEAAPTPVFEHPQEAISTGEKPLPDWLQELAEEIPAEEPPAAEAEIVAETPAPESAPEAAAEAIEVAPTEIPVDEALAWLESLAARQGASQDELVSKPEDRPAEAPAWAMEAETPSEPMDAEQQANYDEIKEAEAAADAIIQAAAQTTGLTLPPGYEFPPVKKPADETTEPAVEAGSAQEKVDLELPEWVNTTAEPPAEETWTPAAPVAVTAPEEAPVPAFDLNTASLVDLESLPGIGFILAQNILNHREQHGRFGSVDDLVKVNGMSPELLAEIRGYLVVDVAKTEPLRAPEPPVVSSRAANEEIKQARTAMSQGTLEEALGLYGGLIQHGTAMDDVIYDLTQAINRQPREPRLWEALGDAYMANDRLQEALDAYNRAEEFIR